MRRLLSLVLAPILVTAPAAADDPPEREVVVTSLSGGALATWPAYAPDVDRFAARPASVGSGLAVRATSSDPGATVRVNGRPAVNGQQVDVAGLEPGDEVNVQITDRTGTSNQSWIYLAPDFPSITTSTAGAGPTPGGLTSVTLRAGPGQDSYATLVDTEGVPALVLTHSMGTSDLQRQPSGSYSLAVALAEDLWGDHAIEEYDAGFRKVATHRMVGHPKTDFHDSILLPGGGRILMAYIKAEDGQTDSWLQEVSPAGEVLLNWNSRDHVDRVNDPILNALGDYAHLNSMQVLADGDLLLSFRHLNQVMKIDRTSGEVVWRLGGRRSDFDFVDDPLGGPCAQHTARELANGDIQVFDNGSGSAPSPSAGLCPVDGDPEAEAYRPSSRVTVYRLDEAAGTASLVQSHDIGAFSQFAGSAQRLGAGTLDDHVLVGTNNAVTVPGGGDAPDAVELDATGAVVWSLTSPGFATYRAARFEAPDRLAPEVAITSPADGAVVAQGAPLVADFGCSDTGGANLDTCAGSTPAGSSLSGVPGTHRLTVRATDRAGNETTRTVTWTVVGTAQPTPPPATPDPIAVADVLIRKPGGGWLGRDTIAIQDQTLTWRPRPGATVSTKVRIRNSGEAAGRMRVFASTGNRWASARWYAGKRDVTRQVRNSRYRTARLAPGESVVLRLVVTVRRDATGRTAVPRLGARARYSTTDVVRARVEVR